MDYITLIEKSSFDEISHELSHLSEDTDPHSLENISLFLTHKICDTFGKQELPRLACRALIHKGPAGIDKLMFILSELDGFIYPVAIISSIWYASNGNLDPFHLGGIPIYPPLNNLPSQETVTAAKDAFNEIIINGLRDTNKFSTLVGFLHQQSLLSADYTKLMSSTVKAITDSSIKITKRQIHDFANLINATVREEEYQIFLENNPVFINPLANKVIDKQKLGDDLITDFVVQTL